MTAKLFDGRTTPPPPAKPRQPAFLRPFPRFLRPLQRRLSTTFARCAVAVVLCGFLGCAGSAWVSSMQGPPIPTVHDEFSYLLAADTFAHGRLTNPTPPEWPWLETFQEIMQPTYMSKYAPAQGLTLALGQALTGLPAAGVWLSAGLMSAAFTWMMFAWFPRRWALGGGLIGTAAFGIFTYWSHSYWGGSVSAIGGALVYGAVRRLAKAPRARDAIWLAMGFLILANSRPFEGLVISIPAIAWCCWWMILNRGMAWRVKCRKLILPAGLVLLIGFSWTGHYQWRITGSPFHTPYTEYQRQYMVTPLFFLPTVSAAPVYHNAEMAKFHALQEPKVFVPRPFTLQRVGHLLLMKLENFIAFFGPRLLIITWAGPLLLLLPLAGLRGFWWRIAAAALALGFFGHLAGLVYLAHYSGPLIGVLLLLFVHLLRKISLWRWRGLRLGRRIILLYAVALCALLGHDAYTVAFGHISNGLDSYIIQRPEISRDIIRRGGPRNLVLVVYGPHHFLDEEWVYNDADIPQTPILWARSLSKEADAELLAHHPERTPWKLYVDFTPELTPYDSSSK